MLSESVLSGSVCLIGDVSVGAVGVRETIIGSVGVSLVGLELLVVRYDSVFGVGTMDAVRAVRVGAFGMGAVDAFSVEAMNAVKAVRVVEVGVETIFVGAIHVWRVLEQWVLSVLEQWVLSV